MHIQVLGRCRFSLLVQGDFQTTREDPEPNPTTLCDRGRMRRCMCGFVERCVSEWLVHTGRDFNSARIDVPELAQILSRRLGLESLGTRAAMTSQTPPIA